eukprot:COSAG02_NODE_1499_length_12268_cov_12.941984_2_plen_433_part_00
MIFVRARSSEAEQEGTGLTEPRDRGQTACYYPPRLSGYSTRSVCNSARARGRGCYLPSRPWAAETLRLDPSRSEMERSGTPPPAVPQVPPRRQDVVVTPPRTRSTGTPPRARPALGTPPKPRPGGTVSAGDELRASRIAQHGQVAVSFYQFDVDKSGYLDESEIGAFCKTLGLLLTDAEVSQALDEMEIDGTRDGKIDFDEFAAWWASGSRTKQRGSLAFRLQQAKEEAFRAEVSGGSPMGRMLSQKQSAPAESQDDEAPALPPAPSHATQVSSAAAVGGVDPSAKRSGHQERTASPVAAGSGADATLEAQLRARREAEERVVEDVQHKETSRLFDDTATTCCSRSVVVVLVAAVVICAFVILISIWDASWEISGAAPSLIVCVVVISLFNFVLVMCWWFNCSWMKGRRFVCCHCMRNTDYPEPVKLHENQP